MNKLIFCQKNKQKLPGLLFPPFTGQLGERIHKNISQDAWNEWLKHQTMLINEYRLNVLEEKSKVFLQQEAEKFLFSEPDESK